jgi:hypothetical protein
VHDSAAFPYALHELKGSGMHASLVGALRGVRGIDAIASCALVAHHESYARSLESTYTRTISNHGGLTELNPWIPSIPTWI